MQLFDLLSYAVDNKASDIFLQEGDRGFVKVGGVVCPLTDNFFTADEIDALIIAMYSLAQRDYTEFKENGDDDFSFQFDNSARFRANIYRQQGKNGVVIRLISKAIPTPEQMRIPPEVMSLCNYRSGLILITGTAGSGKSTTQACLIDQINKTRPGHIITLEDPVEYVHKTNKCIITHRDVTTDSTGFGASLRAALRQAPDVILVGEMRDCDTISTAVTAAETGHLVIATIHTAGAVNAIDRIVDSFPAVQQQQVRTQLSFVLDAVLYQQLIKDVDGNQIPVFELFRVSNVLRYFIRQNMSQNIQQALQNCRDGSMFSVDEYLIRLATEGLITKETAVYYCENETLLRSRLKMPPVQRKA